MPPASTPSWASATSTCARRTSSTSSAPAGRVRLRQRPPRRRHARLRGQLPAAGRQIPLELDATVREIDGELEIEGVTEADHRHLAMTWSPLGILRAPSKLIVRGRLVRR